MQPVDAGGVAIERFRKQYRDLDSYIPMDYVKGAESVLARMGWLVRPLGAFDFVGAALLIQRGYDNGLSVDDYPFLLLWALMDSGVLHEVPGLRRQLLEWRSWWEAEYDEVLDFLPPLFIPKGGDT